MSPPVDATTRTARVKAHAREVGFDLVGVAPPQVPEAYARYRELVARGYGADMGWLYAEPELREDVRRVHPSARAVIALAVSYASEVPGYLDEAPGPDEGWIARYAQGRDYHAYVKKLLVRLVRRFAGDPLLGGLPSTAHRIFVDTGPVLEKAFAARAGLGWIGKHTLLLNRERGSWVFLAVVLTPLELAFDEPATDHCGSCTRCIDVCPTDAIPAPYQLDARRCIATWTIESADPLGDIEPEGLGRHLFGCDLCQEVCPWNRKMQPTGHDPLRPRKENVRPALAPLVGLDQDAFKARFPKSAVRRTDAARMGLIARLLLERGQG